MSVPESPIVSPAAWLGAEQRGSSNWIHVLTATEKTDLDTAIQAHRRRREPLSSVIKSDYPIPALAPVIGSWLRELDDGRGFILVRGFPVAEYSEEDAAFAYWLIGLHLGQPVPQNRKGELLGHVSDDGADPNNPAIRLYRSRARLDFHTDGADIIGLLCLQDARSGGTSRIASSVSVFNEILRRRPDLIRVLFGNFYWDREADALAGEPPYFSFPICRFDQGRLGTLYIGWYIRNAQRFSEVPRLTGEQREALDLIDLIANDEAFYLDMNFDAATCSSSRTQSLFMRAQPTRTGRNRSASAICSACG